MPLEVMLPQLRSLRAEVLQGSRREAAVEMLHRHVWCASKPVYALLSLLTPPCEVMPSRAAALLAATSLKPQKLAPWVCAISEATCAYMTVTSEWRHASAPAACCRGVHAAAIWR